MFGIGTLLDNGFDVEVWNFMPFLKNEEYQKQKPPDPSSFVKHSFFRNKEDAISAITGLSPACCVVSGIHYNHRTIPIYRELSKKKILYCSLLAMAYPIGSVFRKNTLRRLRYKMFLKIPLSFFGIAPANIVLAMGEKYFLNSQCPANRKSEVLWVHYYDYDVYLKSRLTPSRVDLNTGVFLDEYLPFHPDNASDQVPPPVEPEEYYPLLCNFFNYLEKNYDVRIIIAAHPRSHYESKPDYFEGRTIIRGKTAELVKNSGFVLMHQSFSMNFAILFKKPIIFMTTNKLNKNLIEEPSVEWLGKYFGKKVHNLNREVKVDLKEELIIKESAYRKYKNDYIKKEGSEELPLWQIFSNRIKGLNGNNN